MVLAVDPRTAEFSGMRRSASHPNMSSPGAPICSPSPSSVSCTPPATGTGSPGNGVYTRPRDPDRPGDRALVGAREPQVTRAASRWPARTASRGPRARADETTNPVAAEHGSLTQPQSADFGVTWAPSRSGRSGSLHGAQFYREFVDAQLQTRRHRPRLIRRRADHGRSTNRQTRSNGFHTARHPHPRTDTSCQPRGLEPPRTAPPG